MTPDFAPHFLPWWVATHGLALALGFALGAWALRFRVRYWREAHTRCCGRRALDREQFRHGTATIPPPPPP